MTIKRVVPPLRMSSSEEGNRLRGIFLMRWLASFKRRGLTCFPLVFLFIIADSVNAQSLRINLETVVTGLNQPVYFTNAHDGTNRRFIIEQPGRILVMQPGSSTRTTFLDISGRVLYGGERGLLGLAFHPWSPALLRRSRLAVQGTIDAGRLALENGIAANLAGGTHHAFADHGEGYCVLNDVAVSIRVLQGSSRVRRALIVDLDVHQGNGTAAIFEDDPDVFTFSIHGENNYPLKKERSSLDVGLPDGIGNEVYLETLATHLPQVFGNARPDVVFYLAGVDAALGDRYGRLTLTPEGIRARERLVLKEVWRQGVPVVLVLAGGYARTPEATADLHAMVHRESRSIF